MHSSSPTSIACTSNILQLCPSTKVVGSYFPIEVIMMVMEASITSRAEPSLLAIRGRLFFDLRFEVGRLGVGKVFDLYD